jgi:DUF1680 family protein
VNLYIGGQATTALQKGAKITARQTTNYPWDGHVQLQIAVERPQEFTLHLRVPAWSRGSTVTLNGRKISPPVSKGYAHIQRKWSDRDVLELSIPLDIEKLEANPNVLQSRGKIALRRGPLVYCLEQADNQADLDRIALPATAKLTEHFEAGLLGGVTVITGEGRLQDSSGWERQLYRPARAAIGEAASIKAIPYCVWGNRGQQRMKVWIDSPTP